MKKKNYFSKKYYADKAELKREHRSLCKKYHPDLGGNHAVMVAINQEYSLLKQVHSEPIKQHSTNSIRDEILDFLDDLGLDWRVDNGKIIVERGSNVYACKEDLKKVGFWWDNYNKYWYWIPLHDKRNKHTRGHAV